MIGLALGVGRSPVCFMPPEEWPANYQRMLRGEAMPPQALKETPDILRDYSRRIEDAYATLNAELKAFNPDTVLIIGDDNMEVFSGVAQPSLNLFLGEEVWGYKRVSRGVPPDENERFSLSCNPELARFLLDGLIEREFDFTWQDTLQPLGRPEIGIGHAFTAPVVKVLDGLDVPVIPLMQNVRHKPIISARRCYDLGRAIHDVLEQRDERVAVITTGGLSVYKIDEALDRWLLDQIRQGKQERLTNLFVVDSNNVQGETGELRNWVTMSATLDGVKGTILDYIPCYHGVCGLAFAYLKP
jgi:protocatechuate 4,5-dioxygenase beta chain